MRPQGYLFPIVLFFLCMGNLQAQDSSDVQGRDVVDDLFPAQGNFLLDLGIGGGTPFSINSRGPGIITRAPKVRETESFTAETLQGEYGFSNRLAVGFQVPLGVVGYLDKRVHLPGIYDHFRFGMGDVSAWIVTPLKRETAASPSVTMVASVDSGTTRYSSLGDGFASCGIGVKSYKSLSNRLFVTGEASAFKRFPKDGLDPGILGVPGLGGGMLTPNGKYRIEVVSEYLWSNKASSDPNQEGDSKFSLSVRLQSASTRHRLEIDILGVDHISRGGYGFSLSVPLYPREKFHP
jgi:hypothetical protein